MLNTFFQAKSNYLDSIIEDWKNLLATTTSPSSYGANEKNISESSLQAMISEEQQQDTLPESSEEKRSPSSKSNSKEHKQTMTPLYYSPDHKEVYRPSLDDKIVGTSDDDLFAMSLRDNDNLELTPTTNTDTVDESEKEDDEEGYYEEDIDQNATVIVTPSSTSYAQENENMEQVNSIIKETFTPYYGGSILSSTPDGSTSDRNVSSTLSASSTARILDFEKLNGSEISLSSPHFSSANTPIHERNMSTSEHAQQDASNGTIVLNTFISPQSLPLKVLAQMNKESVTIPSERQPATQTDIHLEEAEPGMDFSQQNNVESSYIGDFESPPQSSTYSKSSIASPTLVSEEEIRNSLLAEEERLEFRPQHKFLNDEKENVLDQQDSNVSSNRDKELIETYSRMNSLVEQNEELVQQLSAVLKRNEELRKALLLSETKRNRLSEINKDLTQQVSLSKTKDEELVSHANSPQLESETLLKQTLDEREKLISELQDEIRIAKQENSQLQKLLDPSLYESNNQSQIEQLKTEIRSLQDVIESLNVKFKDSRRKDEETNKRREIELRKEYTVKLSQIEKERHDMEEENVLLKLKIKELEEQVLIAGNKDQEHLSSALEKEEEYVRKITFLKQEHLLQIQELQRSSRVNELSLRKIIDEKELTIQQLQETLGSAISKAPSSSENTVESMIASHHQQIDKLSQEVEAKNETIQKQNNQLENVTMELELLKQRSSTLSGLVVKYERKIHDLELSNVFFEGETKRLQLANTHLQQDISTAALENESLQKVYEEHFNSIQATSRDHEQTISKLQEEKLQVSKKMSILEEELNVLRSKYENLKSLFEKREKSFAVQRENYESQISSMKQHHEKALKELREKYSNLLESKTEKMTNLEQSHMKIEKQDQLMKKLLKDKLIDSFIYKKISNPSESSLTACKVMWHVLPVRLKMYLWNQNLSSNYSKKKLSIYKNETWHVFK
ncbi:hypothetical protein C9374_004683 [Naegleria lovaniensis]|uniref:Uncharacterized protein n=1 Tax=Naegleria lovaniensis TaxID=51637 RepID=A0AA88KP57_NAELO|nr:uncharacterized protein C9374_004683 [Naegleria lovaniensis]KAG2383346.1 hypothetical protein C9374_004683 [Naegleria lovaniensis]